MKFILPVVGIAFEGVTAQGSGDPPPAVNCLNDAWEADSDGVCKPLASLFTLTCASTGIRVEMDESVVPTAEDVSLLGDCAATFDNDSNKWIVDTALDACSTSMSTNQDGTLSFGNTLRADSFSGNDLIFTSNSVDIHFNCDYNQYYIGIEATDVNVVGGNFTGGAGEAEEGQFSFTLTQMSDNNYDTPFEANSVTLLGDDLYFKLSIGTPVANLKYTVEECTVSDDNLGKSYAIIDAQCLDPFVSVTSQDLTSPAGVQTGVGFKYMGFQFIESADDTEAVSMRLSCSTIVCDANDLNSSCFAGCSTGGRRRRALSPGHRQFNVATDFYVMPKF